MNDKTLLKFYDSSIGSYKIPMKEITSTVADSIFNLMRHEDFLIVGLYSLDGNFCSECLKNPTNLGYILRRRSDLKDVRNTLTDSHKRIFNTTFLNKGFSKNLILEMNYKVLFGAYKKNPNIQSAVDEILYLGMLNSNQNEGYTLCLGRRYKCLEFLEVRGLY